MSRLSPVLLLGAGTGEATCGILYLGSYLRRHGIEAYVRLWDPDERDEEIRRSLEALLAHVKPKAVGLSLKWFHHVARARRIARLIRRIAPQVKVVLGGNSATFWWKELVATDWVDVVVLGDGETPLLSLCRGDDAPPNVVTRASKDKAAFGYVQSPQVSDTFYSHFDELFLSELDRASFSGWVAPGKGCGENCLYCGGTRGMQKATFGRAKPFLRPVEAVQKDHREIASRTWQLRYDFAGSTAAFLEQCWEGVDFSRHSCTYFLWGVPPPELAESLSKHFERVYMVLDVGCFSELQRTETLKRGLLKPCPTDAELMQVVEACQRWPNLELEVSGIAGLPFANRFSLAQEKKLVTKLLSLGCSIGYQRLESQPGALVTEHPDRFGMVSEASTFDEFLGYFEQLDPSERTVPMVRYADEALEAAVQDTADEVDALVWAKADEKRAVKLEGKTRLQNAAVSTTRMTLGEWLGGWRVPAKVAKEPVTLVRSVDGTGLSCAPTVGVKKFADASLQQGDEAQALLEVLGAFDQPKTVSQAVKALRAKLPEELVGEVIEHLVASRFLAVRR